MSNAQSGILAMVAACFIWGLSPIFYKLLVHIPASEVLAHRALWSLVLFAGILAVQGRLGEMRIVLTNRRRVILTFVAALMITTNWFLFIKATQIGQNTQSSLGYYIYPLVAVVIGRFVFGEYLSRTQWMSVGLATFAVMLLAVGLGTVPWISLILATTFGIYGALKKDLPAGPVVSVTCEILILLPLWLGLLWMANVNGQGAFGLNWRDSLLLIASGPITSLPLILFSFASRRVPMSTVGVLQYLNPTLQFLCAVLLFGEVFTRWHAIAFPMIWMALAVFSIAVWRQDKAARKATIAASGVSTQVTNPPRVSSAKP